MTNFRNPLAASFAAIILSMCVAAMSVPASARGGGGGGGGAHGGSHGPPGGPPPLILDSGATGRSVSSKCANSSMRTTISWLTGRRTRSCK
jgi:hypothetical protein